LMNWCNWLLRFSTASAVSCEPNGSQSLPQHASLGWSNTWSNWRATGSDSLASWTLCNWRRLALSLFSVARAINAFLFHACVEVCVLLRSAVATANARCTSGGMTLSMIQIPF
jgi:hypothetical protein